MKIIGIDNGTSGAIGIFDTKTYKTILIELPIKTEQNYTKTKQSITRIKFSELLPIFKNIDKSDGVRVYLERPFTAFNFHATTAAARCLESVLIALELAELPFEYIDSKQWQKGLLPTISTNVERAATMTDKEYSDAVKKKKQWAKREIKRLSLEIALRNNPDLKDVLNKENADAVNIAYFFGTKGRV